MAAPNIATLYDFETHYEDALAAYFTNINVGGQTFAQVVTPRTNLASADFLKTPRLQIKAGVLGLGQTGSGTQETQVTVGNVTTNYYSHYQLGLTLDVVTERNNNAQNHGILRGATRQGMLQYTASMNNTSVPYYQTAFVNPMGTVQGMYDGNDEIVSQISYMLDVFIPPSSWPNA